MAALALALALTVTRPSPRPRPTAGRIRNHDVTHALRARWQVEQFGQQLRPHQMAMLPDGTTVLARAVIEHNLAAASRLYTAIYFDQLGELHLQRVNSGSFSYWSW